MKPYSLGLYEKSMPDSMTVIEKLTLAKQVGYDYIELSIDESDEKLARLDWSCDDILRLNMAMMDIGIPIGSICLSGHRRFPLGHPDPKIRKESTKIMSKAIRLAARLGIRTIQIAGYDVYYCDSNEETRRNFAISLADSVEVASKYGVVLAFETMETHFMNSVRKAMEWVNEIHSPYLQIYPDTGNITNAAYDLGVSVLDDLAIGAGHIVAIHLKESKPGVYRDLLFGQGHVDFKSIVNVALFQGVRRFVTEFWYCDDDESWRNNIDESFGYFNKLLQSCHDLTRKDRFPAKGSQVNQA